VTEDEVFGALSLLFWGVLFLDLFSLQDEFLPGIGILFKTSGTLWLGRDPTPFNSPSPDVAPRLSPNEVLDFWVRPPPLRHSVFVGTMTPP